MNTNTLAEAYKETLNTAHILNLISRLSKTDQMISLLDAAQALCHEGYPVLAEILLSIVKEMVKS